MTPRQGFGQVLRELRRQRRLSQEALAEAARCSRNYISFVETGRTSPTVEMLVTLAAALQVTPAELMERLQQKLALRDP